MTTFTWNKKLLSSILLALLMGACKSTPMVDKPAVVDKSTATQRATKPADSNKGAETSEIKEVNIDSSTADDANNPLKNPKNILSKRSVYFAFDSDAVNAEYKPMLEAHAKYLLSHNNAKMVLQGNTDDRGTSEYNLALGQRRSVAVKKSLNLLGVQDKQIETVSFGKEKATPGCADDACAQKNRRVDVVYENE